MPRLNSFGQATTGFGRTFWQDSGVVTWDNATGPLKLSDGTPLTTTGANIAYTKNGKWLAFLVGTGVFGNLTPTLPDAALIPDPASSDYIAADGTFAYKIKYQSAGPWRLQNADGSFLTFGGDARDIQVLGRNTVLWTEGGVLNGWNLPFPLVNRKVWWPRAKFVLGRWMVLYQDQATGTLVLDGKVIGIPGNYFRPDFMELNGAVYVVSAPDEGESVVNSLTIPAATLVAAPDIATWQPPQPQPAPTPVPVLPPSPKPESVVTVPDFSHVVTDVLAARPDLAKANTLAAGGEVVKLTVEKIRETDTHFGYVSKVAGETQYEGDSQDSVAFKDDSGAVVSIKILSGVGDAHDMWPRWDVGGALRSTDHWQYPGTATFGPAPTPAPTPTPVPQPTPTPTPDFQAQIDALLARISALERKPVPTIDLSGYLRVGAKASGHVSIMDVAETKQISWDVKNPE